MKLRVLFVGSLLMLVVTAPVSNHVEAQMSSTNFEIRYDAIGAGGDDTSSSATYQLRDTIGGTANGDSSSTSYDLAAGYRQGVFDQVATFETFGLNRGTETAATALSNNVVTVNTADNVSVGDMAYIVQNLGASQATAFGKVIDITGTDITLDFQTTLGGSLTIDGAADYFYTANSTSLSLGTLASGVLSTSAIGWTVDADVDDGYMIYAYENHDLNLVIDVETFTVEDVIDGTVSTGVSEYGARSSDSSLAGSAFDSIDDNFSTALQLVGSRGENSLLNRDFLLLKASIPGDQQSGAYAHTLTLIYVGDY